LIALERVYNVISNGARRATSRDPAGTLDSLQSAAYLPTALDSGMSRAQAAEVAQQHEQHEQQQQDTAASGSGASSS
jgi:hypothetical protein